MSPVDQPHDDPDRGPSSAVYAVPALPPNRPAESCFVRLLALLSMAAAFCLNGLVSWLMGVGWGFIFDSGTFAAIARNRAWFDRPDRWIVFAACVILNLGYLIALSGRWRARTVLLWSVLNVVALIIFDSLVSHYIHHG
jgi:hypothetical protein